MAATIDLNLVRAFIAVHREGSFSAAGACLGVPRSTVSRAVAALEESLGTTLFHRSTRQVAITSAGAALLDRVVPSLAQLEAALADVPERAAVPSGTLRLTTTADLASVVLAEVMARYIQRYPGVRVETRLTNELVDLARERIDLALRTSPRRRLRDSTTLVARRVGTVTIQLYASPSYLARRGVPRTPTDLATHDWITFPGTPPIALAPPSRAKLRLAARLETESMWCLREVLKAGGGIGPLTSFMGEPEVASGGLVRVLAHWVVYTGAVYLVQPKRAQTPPKVAAFRDLLLELLRQRPLQASVEPPG